MGNNKIRKDGIAVTNALDELYKFSEEIIYLKEAIHHKLYSFFGKDPNGYRIKFEKRAEPVKKTGNDWFFEWTGLVFPLFENKTELGHLNYQLSFSGDSIVDPSVSNERFPLIHISFWYLSISENNYFTYPIRRTYFFDDDCPGEFCFLGNENSVLGIQYEDGDLYWTYSVELMKIHSNNIEDILIKPVIELLENKKLIIDNHPSLSEAILKYPTLEEFIF